MPVLKASIRLLTYIFVNTTDLPEFQRQISIPNIPKFSLSLITLAERQEDHGLQVSSSVDNCFRTESDISQILAMSSLTQLITLYPSLHRALQPQLSNLTLKHMDGSTPRPTSSELLETASSLYSVLHLTGGKVGATNHWRKSLDDTLAFSWEALSRVRATFSIQDESEHSQFKRKHWQNVECDADLQSFAPRTLTTNEDPLISIPLHIDRLRSGVHVLCDLLRWVDVFVWNSDTDPLTCQQLSNPESHFLSTGFHRSSLRDPITLWISGRYGLLSLIANNFGIHSLLIRTVDTSTEQSAC